MQEEERILEQSDPVQEQREEAVRVKNGGTIRGVEGGLRLDVFEHDLNSEYDFSEDECPVCELPEHAVKHIIEDIEYEEGNA